MRVVRYTYMRAIEEHRYHIHRGHSIDIGSYRDYVGELVVEIDKDQLYARKVFDEYIPESRARRELEEMIVGEIRNRLFNR